MRADSWLAGWFRCGAPRATCSACRNRASPCPAGVPNARWTEKDLEGGDWERREVRLAKGLTYDAEVLPPEWTQWLRKARAEPPTAEEIAK